MKKKASPMKLSTDRLKGEPYLMYVERVLLWRHLEATWHEEDMGYLYRKMAERGLGGERN